MDTEINFITSLIHLICSGYILEKSDINIIDYTKEKFNIILSSFDNYSFNDNIVIINNKSFNLNELLNHNYTMSNFIDIITDYSIYAYFRDQSKKFISKEILTDLIINTAKIFEDLQIFSCNFINTKTDDDLIFRYYEENDIQIKEKFKNIPFSYKLQT